MRASRLLSIQILLQLRVRLTAEALAEEFGVSVRTIYRDIDELSAAGIPVYGDRGPGGGFQLVDGYRTRLTGLNADETEAMLMIGLPGPAGDLGLGPAAQRARGKLLASLPAASTAEAGRMSARFHMDPVDWYRAADPVKNLPSLTRAVLDQRVVVMRYESWTSTREWKIEPLGLVLKGGAWYVVAQSSGKMRVFKVSNILDQHVQDDVFERPADFDLPVFWAESLERFERELRPERAILRISPIGLKRLAETGAYAAEAVKHAAEPDSRGWSRVELPFENAEQGARLLMSLGAEVNVEKPVELKMETRRLAREIANRMK